MVRVRARWLILALRKPAAGRGEDDLGPGVHTGRSSE
jgi:hypothetical protein